jgi:hypothetical protein
LSDEIEVPFPPAIRGKSSRSRFRSLIRPDPPPLAGQVLQVSLALFAKKTQKKNCARQEGEHESPLINTNEEPGSGVKNTSD